MEDEQSTQPADDPILSTLSDTEVSPAPADDEAVETQNDEVSEAPEAETESEVEPVAEEAEEVEAAVDPQEEARRRYEERQAYKAERAARVQNQTAEYTNEATDEYDQRLRNMEVQRYTELIENTENKLVNEFERAKSNPELQIFNPDSQEFNQKAYDKALRDFNAGYVNYDANGNMVGLKGSLFEHLTETASLLKGAIKSGAIQQVRAGQRMRSSADVKPAASPKESAKDPILDILKAD